MKADGRTIELRRFVRPISVLRTVKAHDRFSGPSLLSRFDGVLGLGLQARDWPPPALRHLTLGALIAETLTAKPQREPPSRPRPESSTTIESSPDIPLDTGTREGGEQRDDDAPAEPRVRDVIREAVSRDPPEIHDGQPESEIPGMPEHGPRATGNNRRFSSNHHDELQPPQRHEADDEFPTSDRPSKGTEPPTMTGENRERASTAESVEDETTQVEARMEADEQGTAVRATERTTSLPTTSPPLTVQAPRRRGERATPSRVDAPPSRIARTPVAPTEPGTGIEMRTVREPSADPGAIQSREAGFLELESGGLDTPAPGDPAGQSRPRLTVCQDGPWNDPRIPETGTEIESTNVSEDSKPPARSAPSATMPEVDERALTDAIDIERLTDRLYRALERKQRIERERRGL